MISCVAREEDVVRCWIPLQTAQKNGLGTLEFRLGERRLRFDDVREGDVVPRRSTRKPQGVSHVDARGARGTYGWGGDAMNTRQTHQKWPVAGKEYTYK